MAQAVTSAGATVAQVYEAHADFVWRTLARFGVPEADRPDQLQEVFVVVHRRLPEFRGDAALTTWLFGIARRVAAAYRRRSYRHRETASDEPYRAVADATDLDDRIAEVQARAVLDGILNKMSLDQRAVFVMFEVDGLTGQEIADMMDCPLQTIFSRLRRARTVFERELARVRNRESQEGAR